LESRAVEVPVRGQARTRAPSTARQVECAAFLPFTLSDPLDLPSLCIGVAVVANDEHESNVRL
jgi:hypothetical protein